MEEHNWKEDFAKSLAVFLNGKDLISVDDKGRKVMDDNFYLIFNAYHEGLEYKLPKEKYGKHWEVVLNSGNPAAENDKYLPEQQVGVEGRTVILLKTTDR